MRNTEPAEEFNLSKLSATYKAKSDVDFPAEDTSERGSPIGPTTQEERLLYQKRANKLGQLLGHVPPANVIQQSDIKYRMQSGIVYDELLNEYDNEDDELSKSGNKPVRRASTKVIEKKLGISSLANANASKTAFEQLNVAELIKQAQVNNSNLRLNLLNGKSDEKKSNTSLESLSATMIGNTVKSSESMSKSCESIAKSYVSSLKESTEELVEVFEEDEKYLDLADDIREKYPMIYFSLRKNPPKNRNRIVRNNETLKESIQRFEELVAKLAIKPESPVVTNEKVKEQAALDFSKMKLDHDTTPASMKHIGALRW